jgi:hypothetical protein
MATVINEAKTIVLLDGKKVTAKPLKISLLRKFMKKFEGIAEVADDNDASMDILMECVHIALSQYDSSLAELTAAELEEILDLPTVYDIVEEASGIKLGDSDLLSIA